MCGFVITDPWNILCKDHSPDPVISACFLSSVYGSSPLRKRRNGLSMFRSSLEAIHCTLGNT